MAWKTGLSSGGPNHCAFNHDSGAHIFPERDQQLSRQRHDRRLAPTTAAAFHSVLEPESERRARLMAYPKPGDLNHRCSESWVARLRDALLAIDRPALPRRWGEAGISGDLSAVVEVSGESFTPEDRSELRPNAMDIQQHRRRGRHFGLFCAEQRIPLVLYSLDLLEKQFEPIEFSTNLGFEMLGQATAIASLNRIQPRPPIATQRLIPGCALREEQSFDPVERHDGCTLHDLVFQGGDRERPMLPIGLRYVRPARRLRSISSPVDPSMKIVDPGFEVRLVVMPRHAIHAGGGFALKRVKRRPERVGIDVVEERGELSLLPLPCGLPYAVQRLGQARPTLRPVRALLIRVPLGPRP